MAEERAERARPKRSAWTGSVARSSFIAAPIANPRAATACPAPRLAQRFVISKATSGLVVKLADATLSSKSHGRRFEAAHGG
jgi:hypothetical protein